MHIFFSYCFPLLPSPLLSSALLSSALLSSLPLSSPPLLSPLLSSPLLSSPLLRVRLREESAQLGAEAENYGNKTLSTAKFQGHTHSTITAYTHHRKRTEATAKREQKNYVCLFCCALSPVGLLFHFHPIVTNLIKDPQASAKNLMSTGCTV